MVHYGWGTWNDYTKTKNCKCEDLRVLDYYHFWNSDLIRTSLKEKHISGSLYRPIPFSEREEWILAAGCLRHLCTVWDITRISILAHGKLRYGTGHRLQYACIVLCLGMIVLHVRYVAPLQEISCHIPCARKSFSCARAVTLSGVCRLLACLSVRLQQAA